MSSEEAIYQTVYAVNSCGFAILTFLVYDWIVSIGLESRLIWPTPRSSASMLYFLIRSMVLLEWIVGIVLVWPVSDKVICTVLYWGSLVFADLAMVGPSVFSALRVYALTGRNKCLAGLTLALGLVPLIVNISTAYQSHPVNAAPPYNCSVDSSTTATLAVACESFVTALSRGALALADLIVVAVTWWATYRSRKLVSNAIHRRSFTETMFYNGNIYFVPMACLNMLHITLTALSINVPGGSESFVISFIDPISSLLVCHFLLALQEAKQPPMVGSLASARFTLPHFDPTPLPPFIAPLGVLVNDTSVLEIEGSPDATCNSNNGQLEVQASRRNFSE